MTALQNRKHLQAQLPSLPEAVQDEVLHHAAVASRKNTYYGKMITQPKFFCENCGKEVKRNTKVCPHCGRFFASIKCPACNYLGGTEEFINGCPVCGYAVSSHAEKNTKYYRNKKLKETSVKYKENRYDDPLPWWIYSLVFGIAAILIILTILR